MWTVKARQSIHEALEDGVVNPTEECTVLEKMEKIEKRTVGGYFFWEWDRYKRVCIPSAYSCS
jgi:hypothetical protein